MYLRERSSTRGEILLSSSLSTTVFKGLSLALLFSLLLLLAATLIMYFTALSEAFIPYIIFAGSILSILIGSMYVGKRVEEKGWLRGGLTGLLYVLILLFLGFVFQVIPDLGAGLFTKLFLGFSFGALGGILGINS